MAPNARPTAAKRNREKALVERRQEKEARRRDAKERKTTTGPRLPGEDPDLAGIKSDDPAKNGCHGDRDGDGITDDKDACPEEKGKADPDPQKNGCPTLVRVTKKEIVILQQVQFKTAPQNTLALAQFMHRTGAIRNEPKSWRDYFFDDPATAGGS